MQKVLYFCVFSDGIWDIKKQEKHLEMYLLSGM